MSIDEFVSKYLGKKVDFDGVYGGQCVDLYRQYVQDVLGFPQSPLVRGAADIWDTASKEYYDFITNDYPSNKVPEKGDIVIWSKEVGGGYGHVAIFLEGNVNTFTSLDQNWPLLDQVTSTNHSYKNVIGWLHPKKGNMPEGKVEVDKKTFEELVTKSTRYDEFVKEGFDEVGKVLEKINDLKGKLKGERDVVKSLSEQIALLEKQVAAQKGEVTKREAEIESLKAQLTKQPVLQGKRKMLVAIVTPLVVVGSKLLADYVGVEISSQELLYLVLAGLAYIGVEGSKDFFEATQAKS